MSRGFTNRIRNCNEVPQSKTQRKYRYRVLSSHLGPFSGAFFHFDDTSGPNLQLVHGHLIGKETTGSRKWVRIFFFRPRESQSAKDGERYAYLTAGLNEEEANQVRTHTVDSETKQFLFQPRCALLLLRPPASPLLPASDQRPTLTPATPVRQ